MKGSREVIEMEEDGDIVFNDNTGCYEPTNWQEIQTKDLKEIEDDN